jgi:recombination protein RecA
MGLNCAIVAIEPGFDPNWAKLHGVDPDNLIVVRPDTGEESFNALYDLITSGLIDLVIYDSIGALLNRSEIEGTDSTDAKMKMGGRANLITWGVHRIMTATYKNNVAVILLNQIRDVMSSHGPGGYQQPGGHALEHNEAIIVQIKNGKDRINAKVDGDTVEIGREIVPVIVRNKLSQGSKQTAHIMFYNKEVDGYPFGIDQVFDIVSTATRFGVVESPSVGRYAIGEEKFHGQKALGEYLMKHPEVLKDIREKVLAKVAKKNGEA